ncbi:hypothetical protein LSS_01034 [Leptospira santarosai serovar Shermani str. LT 821]|uniref:Uncharacterized protein n=1 Tax=Leptospira santarosai serovar Shermani str. LT 821 TaxID=758847 RepID=K8YED3_9LEPT|nr:hypothetical protein LSS_01034 [Leptospira santarosai serovar Shermani str. LT 821]
MGTPARLKRFLTFLDRIHLKSNSGELIETVVDSL